MIIIIISLRNARVSHLSPTYSLPPSTGLVIPTPLKFRSQVSGSSSWVTNQLNTSQLKPIGPSNVTLFKANPAIVYVVISFLMHLTLP